jgi:hypothetical protein
MIVVIMAIPAAYHSGGEQGNIDGVPEVVITGLAFLMGFPFSLIEVGDIRDQYIELKWVSAVFGNKYFLDQGDPDL